SEIRFNRIGIRTLTREPASTASANRLNAAGQRRLDFVRGVDAMHDLVLAERLHALHQPVAESNNDVHAAGHLRKYANADAECDRTVMGGHRTVELAAHFADYGQRVPFGGIRQHQRELVAPQARHDVGLPQVGFERLRDGHQHAIALAVTQAVIDDLEIIASYVRD